MGYGYRTFNIPNWDGWRFSWLPDYSKATTLTSPLTSTGYVISHAVNVTTTSYINNVSVAQGNWYNGAWSGNLNLQMLADKNSTVSGTAGTQRFIPLYDRIVKKSFIIKY